MAKKPTTLQARKREEALRSKVKHIPIGKLKSNPNNPRVLRDGAFERLKKSIMEFPDMLNYRTLVATTDKDGKYIVLGGNMRLRALQDLGVKTVPVMLADHWNKKQRDRFIISDNVSFGQWDMDTLAASWDVEDLANWGLDLPKIGEGVNNPDYVPEYRIVIECTNEAQQQEYYKTITNLGIECKPLTL